MPAADLPRLGLGTHRNDDESCARSVRAALDDGYRHVDTATMYGNEAAVGAGLAAADVDRDDVWVASKVWRDSLAYEDVLESAARSRERLGVDAIDLLYVHWPIETYEPAETLQAFDLLRDRGEIRHVGVCNCTPALLDGVRDHLDAPLLAHQVEMHPELPQRELRAYAAEHDHWLVAYAPLARGRAFDLPPVRAAADRLDATPAQVVLAWLLAKDRVAAIPKATGEAHIRENHGALDVSLDREAVDAIDAIDGEYRVVDFASAPWNA